MSKKLVMILSVLAVLTILVAACTAVPEEPETEDLMVEDTDSEMENDDDMDDSSDSAGSSDAEGDSDAGEGSDQSGAADQESNQEMTDEEMIAFIEEKLDGNHDLERVLDADKTYDEWVETLDRMIGYGADIDEEEKELIINWLLARAESMMEDAAMAMTDEEMLAFLEEKLEDEHSVDFILGQNKTYEEWVETFDNHISYGVDLTEEETEMLINWLLERKASEMPEEEMAMTDDEMIAFIEEKVNAKHDTDRILNADKTYDEWVETLDRMIGYGADINEEEKELIIEWLLER